VSALIIDDELVHYEVLGRGRPLIFVHGWLGSWRYWIPTMQVASAEYRAYALDLWGFGDTAKVPARYTLDAQADLVKAIATYHSPTPRFQKRYLGMIRNAIDQRIAMLEQRRSAIMLAGPVRVSR